MLCELNLPQLLWLAVLGVLLDCLLVELPRWHPLVGFGRCANLVEARLNRHASIALGMLAWSVVVLPPVVLAWYAVTHLPFWASALLHAALLYFCLGLNSLKQHTLPIGQALLQGDLATARRLTSHIVSRDTHDADAEGLSKAAVESLLENGNDAVFGTLFWFAIAGGPGALLFRLANTLDAMWGYRNPRFLRFGRFAARLDDVLNYVPARLTAACYWLLAEQGDGRRRVWQCWRQQSPAWPSPNAGPVMASGAASLGLALGGHAVYDGVAEQRPPLGQGRAAQPADIARAWRLVARSTIIWLGGLLLFTCLGYLWR